MTIHHNPSYSAPAGVGKLPPELESLRRLAREVVERECIPLEPEFLRNDPRTTDQGAVLTLGDHRMRNGALSGETWERLRKVSQDTGLFYVDIPEDMGGLGMGALGSFIVNEELNRSLVQLPVAKVPGALYQCRGNQRADYLEAVARGEKRFAFALTEPTSGSDARNIATSGEQQATGSWRVHGTKTFISGANEADFIMVIAQVAASGDAPGGPTMFLIDAGTPGIDLSAIPMWHTTGSHQFEVFLDVVVDDDKRLGEVGEGFGLAQDFLVVHDRLTRGALACGALSRSLDLAMTWAEERHSFGAPLADRQAIQWMLTDVLMAIKSIRAISYECAAAADRGEDVRTLAAMTKFMAGNWGHEAIDKILQVFGGMGESEEFPIVHWYRNLRHARIGGGTDEVQRMIMFRGMAASKDGELWNA